MINDICAKGQPAGTPCIISLTSAENCCPLLIVDVQLATLAKQKAAYLIFSSLPSLGIELSWTDDKKIYLIAILICWQKKSWDSSPKGWKRRENVL